MQKERRFTDCIWTDLVRRVGVLCNFDETIIISIMENQLFKLATALPYLAGAHEAQRLALNNLLLIIAMSLHTPCKDVFLHKPEDDDDVFHRLKLLYHEDGDHDIQMRGLALMAIVMINDHCHDAEEDSAIGKYNPIVAKKWNAYPYQKILVDFINTVPGPKMDELFPINQAKEMNGWIGSNERIVS